MRGLHPAAWGGFLLNCCFYYIALHVVLPMFSEMDLSALPEADQESMRGFVDALNALPPVLMSILAAQAVALVLLYMRMRGGLTLAFITSALMLPGSLVYLIGCVLSHNRNKYADFPLAPAYRSGGRLFPSAFSSKIYLACGIGLVGGLVGLRTSYYDVGALMLGVGLSALYLVWRIKRNPPLALYDEFFTLTPGVFAPGLLLPYSAVNLATLNEDESVDFEMQTGSGPKTLRWSSLTIAENMRRAALEELGSALCAHRVELR